MRCSKSCRLAATTPAEYARRVYPAARLPCSSIRQPGIASPAPIPGEIATLWRINQKCRNSRFRSAPGRKYCDCGCLQRRLGGLRRPHEYPGCVGVAVTATGKLLPLQNRAFRTVTLGMIDAVNAIYFTSLTRTFTHRNSSMWNERH